MTPCAASVLVPACHARPEHRQPSSVPEAAHPSVQERSLKVRPCFIKAGFPNKTGTSEQAPTSQQHVQQSCHQDVHTQACSGKHHYLHGAGKLPTCMHGGDVDGEGHSKPGVQGQRRDAPNHCHQGDQREGRRGERRTYVGPGRHSSSQSQGLLAIKPAQKTPCAMPCQRGSRCKGCTSSASPRCA